MIEFIWEILFTCATGGQLEGLRGPHFGGWGWGAVTVVRTIY